MAWYTSPQNLLKAGATGVLATNPIALAGAAIGKVDLTPDYSATNVVGTQVGKLFRGGTGTATAGATGNQDPKNSGNLDLTGQYGGTETTAYNAQEAARKAQAVDYINRAYDTKIGGLQNQLRTIDPQEQAANLRIHNQFTNKMNDLNTGLATGKRNLNVATNQVNESKARSLADLSRQMEQLHMGYNNRLGIAGAGDSSAAGMINRGLSMQASRNRGDVLTNASDQLGQIDMQMEDLITSYDQGKRDIDDWKQSTLAELMTGFEQQRSALRAAMQDADLNRQQQLAQYDASLTQSVMDRLSQIESQSRQATDTLIQRYQNMFAPQNIQIAPELQQYQVQAINPGQIAQMEIPNQVATDSSSALLRRFDEENRNLLGV